jgi:hypothetical protein
MVALKKGLALAAVSEVATGVALLSVPSLVGQLLFGVELTGMAMTVARVTGIALIALGVACWPGTPLVGMLTYSARASRCISPTWASRAVRPAHCCGRRSSCT